MVIALTGATGFIGRKLLELFPPEQHSLVVLARANPRLNPLIHFSHWDAVRSEPGMEALDRADAVVHLAGEPVAQRWTLAARRRIAESRIIGTRNLVSAIRRVRHRPKVLVCASASGYYGDRGDEILTEHSPSGEGFLPDICRQWEAEADAAAALGVRVVKLRIGVVLGSGGGALARMVPLFRTGLAGRLGSGRQWMSWIHVDDLTGLIRFAIDSPGLLGAVNAASPRPVTNAEFTRTLAARLGRPAVLPAPAFTLRLAYGEMARILFDSARLEPRAALSGGFVFRYPSLSQALENLAL
jgi:uncharacterized protein (TIGR01777 family)